MNLEHTHNNFTDEVSNELSTIFLQALAEHTLGNCGNTSTNVFFRDWEANAVLLVSICSPVNCNACHGVDLSIPSLQQS